MKIIRQKSIEQKKEVPIKESLVDGIDHTNDLLSIGVPNSYVETFNTPRDLQEDIEFAIKTNSNFIIFGDSGWGKSAAVKAAAKASGMNWMILSVSSMMPEDFGGTPSFVTEIKAIKDGKEVWIQGEKVEDSEKPPAHVETEEDKQPRDIRVMRSDGDIRKHTQSAPPKWVYTIADCFENQGTRTLVFLDEINQGRPDVLNAAFHLVGERTYSDIFNLKSMIIVGAAGNWMGENRGLTNIPFPLLRRFDVRLIAPTDWSVARKYMIKEYPELEELINEIEWDPITNPADVSNAILKRIASGHVSIEDIPRLSTTKLNKSQLMKFFSEHKVEQGKVGKSYTSKLKAARQISELLSNQDFIPEDSDTLPDGSKPNDFYILDLPNERAVAISIIRRREGFNDTEEFDDEFWEQFS